MNIKEQLLSRLRSLDGSRRTIAYTVSTAVIFAAFIYASAASADIYMEAQKSEEEIRSMESFIKTAKEKEERLSAAAMRPIEAKKIDAVQTDILLALKEHSLTINSFKQLSPPKGETVRHDYEVEITGTYSDVIRFAEGFSARSALLHIEGLSMEQHDGNIKAVMQYRVFAK